MRLKFLWTPGLFLILTLCPSLVSAQTAQPTSQHVFDQQRFNDLIAIIEGQNSPQARRTGARELLLLYWPETLPRFVAILNSPNYAAKIAISQALSDHPAAVTTEYILPLIEMLRDTDIEVRKAASGALASGAVERVLPRLQTLVGSADQHLTARLAAIETLGMMTQREAAAVLMKTLQDPNVEIAEAALNTLEQTTAQDFHGDAEAARAWWTSVQNTPATQWRRMQIRRLIRENQAREATCNNLELRLTAALRDIYSRSAEAQRPALIASYLADASPAVRQLGLTLAQAMVAEGKTLSEETIARTRGLLTAIEPEVRAAATGAVVALRDPADAERFRQLLPHECHRIVRGALVNGLGHVGDGDSVTPLLEILLSSDSTIKNEAVTALGRLAERGVLQAPSRKQVSSSLLTHIENMPREQSSLRERLLWALSRTGDPRSGGVFVACLDTAEAGAVRLAAVRGIAVLADPRTVKINGHPASTQSAPQKPILTVKQLLDALLGVIADPDLGVRRAAVETIAQFAIGDEHIDALWSRLSQEQEPEESIRLTAWRGLIPLVAARPFDEISRRLALLPGDDASRRRYAIELLQAAEKRLAAVADARGELGCLRARLAAEYEASEQLEPAISTYLAALDDLRAAASDDIPRVALELLRLTLMTNRYDAQIAAAFAAGDPPLDGQALWAGIRDEIKQRLNPDGIDQAAAMLAAFKTNPPASMPADLNDDLEQLLQQARRIREQVDKPLVIEWLRLLRENPENQPARQSIEQLGLRAAPAVRETLRAVLNTEQPDAAWIQLLHDLLKSIQPEWPGFTPEAPLEEKLKTLE